jgi:predicted nuclease of predicted toxin-antitoxin system
MRFPADESCDFAVIHTLRTAGHDVQAVREACPGAPDEVVMQLAGQETRILLTEDKDFGQLVYAGSGLSVGMIFYPFSRKCSIEHGKGCLGSLTETWR